METATTPGAMDENALAARQYLYRAFQCLFGNDPREEAWDALDAELLEEACGILGVEGAPFARALDCVLGAPSLREATACEYTAALVGPGALPSPPWESAQLSGDGVLFTPVTLEVRNAYRAQGLLPQQYPAVADDHIALECGFLAELAAHALGAFAAHDTERCASALEASRSFAEAHLLRWADRFAERMDGEKAPLYAAAAGLLAAFAEADGRWLAAVAPRAAAA